MVIHHSYITVDRSKAFTCVLFSSAITLVLLWVLSTPWQQTTARSLSDDEECFTFSPLTDALVQMRNNTSTLSYTSSLIPHFPPAVTKYIIILAIATVSCFRAQTVFQWISTGIKAQIIESMAACFCHMRKKKNIL